MAMKPLVSKILPPLIVALIIYAASFVPVLWEPLESLIACVWTFLLDPVSTPAWILFLLSGASLTGLVMLAVKLWPTSVPTWHDYQSDRFHEVRWWWSYNPSPDPLPFCPKDETRLVIDDQHYAFRLQCETCGEIWGPFQGKFHQLQATVKRQIERKIRTGEWRSTMQGAD